MSGDVQPRKRKEKRRKKDELSVDEPRGTSAVLGEGDVFIHSQYDHGTGGHWCAKIIFFFLLAVLIGLIGLIILENRGLSELEANSVESRYSGVLEGWLEDTPSDDHNEEQTYSFQQHDDKNNYESEEEDEKINFVTPSVKYPEEEAISNELPTLPEENDSDDQIQDNFDGEDSDDDEEEFLEPDDDIEPSIVEHITIPTGKPFIEIESGEDTEQPPEFDALAEEEEYEKQQEELRREEEKASHEDGGNSVPYDEWPGDPRDPQLRRQLDEADDDLRRGWDD